MPNPIRTLEQTIAWEHARLGKSRLLGNADWAGGRDVDDCALFQSTAVFGFKAAWNVDVFETIGGGTYRHGKVGLRRGDVVLYDWDGDGSHTEMALTSPDSNGNFQTIGANRDASAAVKTGIRNGYVQGYFRPNYKTASKPAPAPKPTPAAPAAITPEWSNIMFGFVRKTSNGEVSIVDPDTGKKRPLHLPEWLGYQANGAKFAELADTQYDSIPNA